MANIIVMPMREEYRKYLLPDMDKKLKKAILKASHVDKYLEAVGIALMSKNIL